QTVTVTGVDDNNSDGHQDYHISLSAANVLTNNPEVTTLAGSSGGYLDATGTSASFASPRGITTDGTNLYVSDTSNNRIRKIVIDNGTVTTLAGSSSYGMVDNAIGTSARFFGPNGITSDGTNLYVADRRNSRIRKIVIDNGTVTTLAGSSQGYLDNATGTSAEFNSPYAITIDGTNLYVADTSNHRIRKIALRGSESVDVALHNLDDDTVVTVAVSSSDTGEASVSPATLTFTEANRNTAQTVTVTGVDDNNSDG
ncbi:uncharacterized protein METZ01_LOCUS450598, partial [marine metagenome]